jgi:hypothetical protein
VLWLYGSTFLSLKSTNFSASSGLFSCFGFALSCISIYVAAVTPAVPAKVNHKPSFEELLTGVGVVDQYRWAFAAYDATTLFSETQ